MNRVGGSVGCAVLEAGRQSRCGSVRAVFDRSAHLCADGMFFTLGRPDLAPHPYSILWPGYPDALQVGQEMRLTSEGLFSKESGWALFGEMEVFSPKRESRPMAGGFEIAAALSASLGRTLELPCRDGFHEILNYYVYSWTGNRAGQVSSHFIKTGVEECSVLSGAIAVGDEEGLSRSALRLAGMGIGLTPAGDDFLAGVLAALRFHGRSSGHKVFPESRLEQVAGDMGPLTSPFSAFLLAGAAKGWLAEPLADWLDAIHRGLADSAVRMVPQIAELGHSSGLDSLSGMIIALQAVIGERPWFN